MTVSQKKFTHVIGDPSEGVTTLKGNTEVCPACNHWIYDKKHGAWYGVSCPYACMGSRWWFRLLGLGCRITKLHIHQKCNTCKFIITLEPKKVIG